MEPVRRKFTCYLLAMAGIPMLGCALFAAGHSEAASQLQAPRANLCTNGGFEHLKRRGALDWPAGWDVLDPAKTGFRPLSTQAHTGKFAGRLVAEKSEMAGMNYVSGDITRGKISFCYRILKADPTGRNVTFYAIPVRLKSGPLEEVIPPGSQTARVSLNPPPAEASDHKWHRASLAFDFRSIGADGLVFAPRVNEFAPVPGSGEVLLDDVEIVASK